MTQGADERIERIVLIGLSGTGKTTVARILAEQLGWAAADSDDWIVAETGQSIPALFASGGEAHFRQVEHAALQALCRRPRLVLATGAGVVTVAANWPLLTSASRVVLLTAAPAVLLQRLQAQAAEGTHAVRPLLAGDDPLARLTAMAAARAAQYARADLAIDTTGRTPGEVAAAVLQAVTASGVRPVAASGVERGEA